jgi:hypothetical protein
LGIRLPWGLEQTFRGEPRPSGFYIAPLPGAPSIRLTRLYPRDDPWKEWLAGESTCPGGEDRTAPEAVQRRVLLCLLNFARAREGLAALALSPILSSASAAKAEEIERCQEFAHEPCGRPVDAAAQAFGYHGSLGENLYIAEGQLAAPRVAVDRWLNSPGHRENLFRPQWRVVGVGLRSSVTFGRFSSAVLWVNEFGEP